MAPRPQDHVWSVPAPHRSLSSRGDLIRAASTRALVVVGGLRRATSPRPRPRPRSSRRAPRSRAGARTRRTSGCSRGRAGSPRPTRGPAARALAQCPAFEAGCPFRDSTDLLGVRELLEALPASHTAARGGAHAALVEVLARMHDASAAARARLAPGVGDCPVFASVVPVQDGGLLERPAAARRDRVPCVVGRSRRRRARRDGRGRRRDGAGGAPLAETDVLVARTLAEKGNSPAMIAAALRVDEAAVELALRAEQAAPTPPMIATVPLRRP